MSATFFTNIHTHIMKNWKSVIIGLSISVIVVVLSSLFLYHALAQAPTPQQQAAAELPSVLQTIRDTQAAADRNAQAKARQAQLIDCVQNGNCPLAQGASSAQ